MQTFRYPGKGHSFQLRKLQPVHFSRADSFQIFPIKMKLLCTQKLLLFDGNMSGDNVKWRRNEWHERVFNKKPGRRLFSFILLLICQFSILLLATFFASVL